MIRSFSTSITVDPVFNECSPRAQLLYFKLYMHPQNTLCGLFMYSVAHMAVDVQSTKQEANDALEELIKIGFVEVDRACNLVWIPEMAARLGDISGPKNKIAITVKRHLAGVCPRKSPLVDRVTDTLSITLSNTVLDTPSDTLPDRVLILNLNQDPDSDPKQEESTAIIEPTQDNARAALCRFRKLSKDADGVPRVIAGPDPSKLPDERMVSLFRDAIARHPVSQADLDAMAQLIGSGAEWGFLERGVAVSMLCHKAVHAREQDHFANLLGKARTPARKAISKERAPPPAPEQRQNPIHQPVPDSEARRLAREAMRQDRERASKNPSA